MAHQKNSRWPGLQASLAHLLLQPSNGPGEGVLVDLDGVHDALCLVGVAQRGHGLLQKTHAGPFASSSIDQYAENGKQTYGRGGGEKRMREGGGTTTSSERQ